MSIPIFTFGVGQIGDFTGVVYLPADSIVIDISDDLETLEISIDDDPENLVIEITECP